MRSQKASIPRGPRNQFVAFSLSKSVNNSNQRRGRRSVKSFCDFWIGCLKRKFFHVRFHLAIPAESETGVVFTFYFSLSISEGNREICLAMLLSRTHISYLWISRTIIYSVYNVEKLSLHTYLLSMMKSFFLFFSTSFTVTFLNEKSVVSLAHFSRLVYVTFLRWTTRCAFRGVKLAVSGMKNSTKGEWNVNEKTDECREVQESMTCGFSFSSVSPERPFWETSHFSSPFFAVDACRGIKNALLKELYEQDIKTQSTKITAPNHLNCFRFTSWAF